MSPSILRNELYIIFPLRTVLKLHLHC